MNKRVSIMVSILRLSQAVTPTTEETRFSRSIGGWPSSPLFLFLNTWW